jgi:hypothetical protein
MSLRKTPIATQDEILSSVDRVTQARDAKVTKRLNKLFADRSLAQDQARTAGELDVVGTDWSDERW